MVFEFCNSLFSGSQCILWYSFFLLSHFLLSSLCSLFTQQFANDQPSVISRFYYQSNFFASAKCQTKTLNRKRNCCTCIGTQQMAFHASTFAFRERTLNRAQNNKLFTKCDGGKQQAIVDDECSVFGQPPFTFFLLFLVKHKLLLTHHYYWNFLFRRLLYHFGCLFMFPNERAKESAKSDSQDELCSTSKW